MRLLVLVALLASGCAIGVFVTEVKPIAGGGIEVTKCTLVQSGLAAFSLDKCEAKKLPPAPY